MSIATSLVPRTVPSADSLPHGPKYFKTPVVGNNSNNNNKNDITFYHHLQQQLKTSSQKPEDSTVSLSLFPDDIIYKTVDDIFNVLPMEEMRQLEAAASMTYSATTNSPQAAKMLASGGMLPKSNSFAGTSFKPKATIIKQDSLNGRYATSLTDSDSDFGSSCLHGAGSKTYLMTATAASSAATVGSSSSMAANNQTSSANMSHMLIAGDDIDEEAVFLVNPSGSSSTGGVSGGTAAASRRGGARTHGKSHNSFCFRTYAFVNRNWYLSYLVPLAILIALMFVAYSTRGYAKRLLYWIETQNPWVIFTMFMLLFVVVSFPVAVGYFVLLITSGYLFGCLKGFLTVILGANMGIAIAHLTIRSFRHRIPMHKLIKNETGRAILRVISGPRAFKVVLFTRLTPIPFGIQNAIFGVSSINPRVYHTATFLGLLPAQTINVYLGSTLRSMQEVLNNHGTALTGYISFGVELICGAALMFWVVQKARKELSDTLLSDISTDGKLLDIDV